MSFSEGGARRFRRHEASPSILSQSFFPSFMISRKRGLPECQGEANSYPEKIASRLSPYSGCFSDACKVYLRVIPIVNTRTGLSIRLNCIGQCLTFGGT